MKIVYCVAQCNEISGGIKIIFEHVNHLALRGHAVEIWTLDPLITIPPFPIKVPIRYIPNEYDFAGQKVLTLRLQDVGADEPDIFIAGSYPAAYGYKSVPHAKSFWYLQHDEAIAYANEAWVRNYIEAFTLPITFLCNSHWTQEVLKNKYGVEAVHIPYGIDRNLFYHSEKLQSDKEHFSILFVYDPQKWKGAEDFFNALDIVSHQYPKIKIFAISKITPNRISINKLSINFFIRPEQKDLARIYSLATVFVSSSWAEGFGLPGLEAMACGVPVVTTDSGGVRDYAIPEETAIVVPPQNSRALADAIIRVLNDEPLRRKLIKNGLAKVAEFDWERSIDILEGVFKIE
ncbi:MAG: glycosyltransferase family 4 protein [Candidatus Magasanikbacteria bacterium]|nr:glycosyltransferase family 4 protein [Candidatus Magasanikbacteria bacterium]